MALLRCTVLGKFRKNKHQDFLIILYRKESAIVEVLLAIHHSILSTKWGFRPSFIGCLLHIQEIHKPMSAQYSYNLLQFCPGTHLTCWSASQGVRTICHLLTGEGQWYFPVSTAVPQSEACAGFVSEGVHGLQGPGKPNNLRRCFTCAQRATRTKTSGGNGCSYSALETEVGSIDWFRWGKSWDPVFSARGESPNYPSSVKIASVCVCVFPNWVCVFSQTKSP